MKNKYFKILIAVIFFQGHFSIAGSSGLDLNNSKKEVSANISGAETCVASAQPAGAEHWIDTSYQNCLQRNKNRASAQNLINQGGSDAQQISNGAAPINNCGDENNPNYHSCMETYNRLLTAHNLATSAQASAGSGEQTADQKRLSTLNDKSGSGSMGEVEGKNKEGESTYTQAAMQLAGQAAKEFTSSANCAAQCPYGCCGAAMGYAAAGIALMLLNGKANDQAGQHCEAALQACTAQNQLSSEQKKCSPCVAAGAGGIGGGFGGGGGYGGGDFASIVSTNWDDNGACKPTAAQPCTDLNKLPGSTGLGKLPTNCKDKSGKAISCLVSGLAAFKQNPDGSVTVKGPNGNKTYSSADFVDKKSMMAAGMSAADADKLVNELYGKNSALAKAGVDAKNLATDASKDKKYSDSFGNTSTVNLNSVSDANKKFGEKLGDLADRRPSSEGLARDYKGDLIGASGDDIFNMMQRRYKLKSQQDSFIAP